MAIDTKIEGNPKSIRSVSRWLRESLANSTSEAATQIHNARKNAENGWQGPAGEAFSAKMTTGAKKTDEFSAAVTRAAQDTDTYAAKLQRAQNDMRAVRESAIAAGLTVNNHVIEDPGPGPTVPDAARTGAAVPPEEVEARRKAVSAAKTHEDKVVAYNTAKTESEAAHNLAKFAADTLNNVWSDITNKWFVVVGDLTNGAVGTLAAKHSSILKKQSDFLADESARLLERARTAPAGTSSAQLYRDFDLGRSAAYQADDVAGAAKSSEASSAKWGFRAGGALAIGGVAYDIANGKPPVQATVSGGAGFAASVGAGAAIGTMIPVPVLGTAVGAVGGAATGLFASGAVDSLFQNGAGGVGGAIEEGAKTVGDTGKAIGGLAEDAWDAVF